MSKILLKNARIVNEGTITLSDLLISENRIEKIAENISAPEAEVHDLQGHYLLPGMIDDQVHFREPGLTHKGDMATESAACLAGGITSFMEMPNTNPPTTSIAALEEKFERGSQKARVNYSFYLGASNENLEEIKKVDPSKHCGVKVFMGSSTGNMLVDKPEILDGIFKHSPTIIATHCEDTPTIDKLQDEYFEKYGADIPMKYHGKIRSAEACYKSSSLAVSLAKKHNSRLHVLHLTTEKEMELFEAGPIKNKRITAEVCVHHLFFNDSQYDEKGSHIKWNPAIKTQTDQLALQKSLVAGKLDIIATDHAPHTLEEKNNPYVKAPSGGPLVQHALMTLFDFVKDGWLTVEEIAEKTAHNPASIYQVKDRGYIKEGYYADLVVIDPDSPWTVNKENIAYKCGWSPFEGHTFSAKIKQTFLNGKCVYENDKIDDTSRGMRLEFDRGQA